MTRRTFRCNPDTLEVEEVTRRSPRFASDTPLVVDKGFRPFKCWQVSGLHGAPEAAGATHLDPEDGCPVFTSREEVKQFLAAQREQGQTDAATYGDGWSRIDP